MCYPCDLRQSVCNVHAEVERRYQDCLNFTNISTHWVFKLLGAVTTGKFATPGTRLIPISMATYAFLSSYKNIKLTRLTTGLPCANLR